MDPDVRLCYGGIMSTTVVGFYSTYLSPRRAGHHRDRHGDDHAQRLDRVGKQALRRLDLRGRMAIPMVSSDAQRAKAFVLQSHFTK